MKLFGFRRPDGRVGFRNHILILSSVACANSIADKIALGLEGVVSFTHSTGCGLLPSDKEHVLRTLTNVAGNPNVAAVVITGLGCESLDPEELYERIKGIGKPCSLIKALSPGGYFTALAEGQRIAASFAREASSLNREEVSLADLVLGLECGASDPASGISANTSLGHVTDRIIKEGATAILSETPEAIGTEQVLARRCSHREVAADIVNTITCYERMIKERTGEDVRKANPVPGNIKAGISTLEEKSLGCILKGGSSPLNEVIQYGALPSKRGLIFMNTPGFDAYSLCGLVAGGSQVIVFTTGRGTPCGTPLSPVIKVVSNSVAYRQMEDTIDFNAGELIDGSLSMDELSDNMFRLIVQTANGKKTKAEIIGLNVMDVWTPNGPL